MSEYESEEIEIEAIGIEIDSQPIELYKIFKIANLVSGGGEAKHIISEGYVAVNGEIETRKRRKIMDGDLIEFNQQYYIIICADGESSGVNDYYYADDTGEEHDIENPVDATQPSALELEEDQSVSPNRASATAPEQSPSRKPEPASAQTSSTPDKPTPSKSGGRKSIDFF